MSGSGATVGVDGYFENWGVWTESGYAIHGDTFTVDRAITTNGVNLINDEGIKDTLIDLHNYAAMALLLLDERTTEKSK